MDEFDTASVDPTKPFLITIMPMNMDGTLDLELEGVTAHRDWDAAVDDAKNQVREYGGEVYIIECIPRRKVIDDSIKIIDL